MNKKNIQIDTNFFGEDEESIHRVQEIAHSKLTGKSSTSEVNYHRSEQQSAPISYNYDQAPQVQYHQQYLNTDQYQGYIADSPNARKLQSAYQLQNVLSRMAATLFINCWQTLKALLPHYHYLRQQEIRQSLQNQEVLKDFSNNQNQNEVDEKMVETNVFTKEVNTVEERKNQVLERQRRGITLDSLEKQRLERSKSGNRLQRQKGLANIKPIEYVERVNNIELQQRQPAQQQKSYREKFQQYKMQHKSNEQQIPSYQHNDQNTYLLDYFHKYSNLNHAYDSIPHNPIIQNQHRQYIKSTNNLQTQSDPYKSFKYSFSNPTNLSSYEKREVFSYKNPPTHYASLYNVNEVNVNENMEICEGGCEVNGGLDYDFQRNQILRAKLLEEITEKLNSSKLRADFTQRQTVEELQMIRKIAKLEKLILQLRKQAELSKSKVNTQQAQPQSKPVNNNRVQQQQLFKKFLQQINLIRSEINQIKISRQPPQINQGENQSRYIINQQQQLLNSYQRQFQRLVHEKTLLQTKIYLSHQNSLENRITQNQQNDGQSTNRSQKKIVINDGWSEQVHNFSQQNTSQMQNYSQKQTEVKTISTQTTGKRLLNSKQYIEQWLDKDLRQIQVRKMVQNVKRIRKETIVQQGGQNQRYRPIREKYQQEYQRRQKQLYHQQQEDNCCVLFPY